jgi:hypothetical protein
LHLTVKKIHRLIVEIGLATTSLPLRFLRL